MKKRFLTTIIITLVIAAFLTSCGTSIHKQFMKAVENGAKIKKANQSANFEISLDSANSKLSEEKKSLFAMYGPIKGSITAKYDLDKNMSYAEGNVGASGMGFDFKMYDKNNKVILQIPIFPKYIVIDKNTIKDSKTSNQISTQSAAKLNELLKSVITKDKIKKVSDKKITSGGQEISVTEFSLLINDADLKKIITGAFDTLLSDGEVKKSIVKSIKEQSGNTTTDKQAEDEINTMLKEIKDSLNKVTFENINYTGAITKDKYIVEQNISSAVVVKLSDTESLKLNFKLTNKLWDIGKDITFDVPKLDKENSTTLEELNQSFSQGIGGY